MQIGNYDIGCDFVARCADIPILYESAHKLRLNIMDQFQSLDERSQDIFRKIVESYIARGEPLGSRNLSKQLAVTLSPASVRNVMSDLEQLGLIYAPHTSAGRMPTELGLRYFVDGFMEVGDLTSEERVNIENQVNAISPGQSVDQVLTEASQMLSGLSMGAGMVITGKRDVRLKHIEFVRLEPAKALVVMVSENGSIENRILDLPLGLSTSNLHEATNFLNAHVAGRTLSEAREEISERHAHAKQELDGLAKTLVDQGLATWAGASAAQPLRLIVRGRANLLGEMGSNTDLERLRQLFDELESKEGLMQLLDLTEEGEGVRIFIGSENNLFSLSGSSVIVAPYRDSNQRIIGAVGVIGPTRLNYARVIPMVDYTAQVVSRILG